MKKKKVVLLGAGPASLAAGLSLIEKDYEVTILERESVIGGISKTIEYKGYRFDVGGHRFFTKNKDVNDLWQKTLGNDFVKTPRLSRIYYQNKFFSYPVQIGDTLKKAGVATSFACVASFVRYRLFPIKPEKSFADWVTNHFGRKLFLMFFKSYSEKLWGISTDDLSADWAAQRIKGLSMWETVKNALFKPKVKAKSLIDEFYYPKYGPGMMYERMGKLIELKGGKIITNCMVTALVTMNNKVEKIEAKDKSGKSVTFAADYVISTIPLPDTARFIEPKIKEVQKINEELRFRDFISINLIIDRKELFPDTWIYVHDPRVKMGRIQNFKNWSKYMTPKPNHTPIGCEYFCDQGDELWNTGDKELIKLASKEIEMMGLLQGGKVLDGCVYRMRDAYPVYFGDYQTSIKRAKKYIDKIDNLWVAGRGGMFRYNNMDHSILTGIYAASSIMGDAMDPWAVNEEQEYHETEKKGKTRTK